MCFPRRGAYNPAVLQTIKSSFALALCSLATLAFGIAGLFFSLFAPPLVIPLAVRPWGRALLLSLGVRLTVSGEENIPLEPSVIMYNHQSSVDIPALVASLPGRYKLVMKDEVLRVPFVGWVSKLNGHFFVSRDGGGGDSKQLKIMTRAIREKKQTLVLAPEGTRSESGRLLDFKKGGFLLAALSGAPVVPMVIRGGRAIKPKRGPLKTGGRMSVEFLPPVRTAESGGRAAMEALERGTREAMLRALEQWQDDNRQDGARQDGTRKDGDNSKDGENPPDGPVFTKSAVPAMEMKQ